MSRPHFLQPLLRRTQGTPVLKNRRTGLVVASRIESAFDSADRRKGLLGRTSLPPGHVLIIAPTNLVHTFAMRFAIDILFMARDGRVLKISRAVPRRRIAGSLRAFAVLEFAAGHADSSDIRVGDVLDVAYG
jgi:uncharacterized membrane protein (UPF0127 family)